MFYRSNIKSSNIKLAVAFIVCAVLAQSGLCGGLTRARAQTPQQQQTPKHPSTQTPQQSPKPTPTPKTDDDVTLQDGDVVRVETDLTNILFTASDKQKRFITNLRQEDVRVTEDGQPQEIFTFARQTDLPLSLAILVDTSASEERTLPEEKAAAAAFVDAVIRPDKDEAAVVSFTGDATLEQGLTSSLPRIRRGLESVRFEPPAGYIGNGTVIGTPPISGSSRAGSTAIWDAIWSTSEEILSNTSDKTRRAIILITDGQDTSSRQKMNAAIDRAIKADAVIYSIGYGDLYLGGINEGALRKVSETTGGRAFFPRDESDLRAAFAQIQQELRSQYLVAYSPTNKTRDGSFRRVQVEIINPELRKQSLRLTYRQGYFAKTKS
jgi:Ca-activated chloride channel family protein